MKTKIFPRFISMCLAASITLSFGTAIPTSAENIDTELDYYISLDANSDEYQEWKATYSSGVTANTISTFDLRGSSNGISNEYIEITLNGNRYTLGTTGGNPDSAADNNQKLLYGYPGGGTSYTTVQIDGVNNIFTPQTTTFRDNSIISTAVIGDVVVTQYLNIIHNQYTGRDDVAEFFYTAENTGDNAHKIGIRIMFDTMLGRNDSAPFRLHNLENLCVNATSYFEFEFDSDEQLQPNQEIIINSSINNTSWSKIVASNDYSAVGDDSLAENGYLKMTIHTKRISRNCRLSALWLALFPMLME